MPLLVPIGILALLVMFCAHLSKATKTKWLCGGFVLALLLVEALSPYPT
jgi:hypothetical protein